MIRFNGVPIGEFGKETNQGMIYMKNLLMFNLKRKSHGGSIFHPEVAYSRNVLVALSLRPL